ncbi:hypothetical protein [Flammeovirga sp. SJP92]|uniref:hypothetical protein n=1 Tax=Flammeovirga sp. SJP92 TaxID=1775430 RepID=UPI0007887D70|nr:hypothetical protein [Flammeovirga sp. SJP92]KXX69807.1 hypothetical protein AVL50_13030 [Flammeovirga sp. SJP92]
MNKSFPRLIILFFCLVAGIIEVNAQSLEDSLIVDINNILYKRISKDKGAEYFDLNGKPRVLGHSKCDTLKNRQMATIFKIVGRKLNIPSSYVRNSHPDDFQSEFIFKCSFLIEKTGEVTNVRLIGKLPSLINPYELFPPNIEFPTLDPVTDENGDPIVVERVDDIYVTCLCSPPRYEEESSKRKKRRKKLK